MLLFDSYGNDRDTKGNKEYMGEDTMRKPRTPYGSVWCRGEDNWKYRDACLKVQDTEPYRACKRCVHRRDLALERENILLRGSDEARDL